jgi:hypothetical protein
MEPRFGHDFSNVRVHANEAAARSAAAVSAAAYTVGSHIAFAAGRYAPGTGSGRQLFAHELTHVVQQTADTSNPNGDTLSVGNILQRQENPSASAVSAPAQTPPASASPCDTCQLDEPPYRAQPSSNSCWAAAATMLVSWHDSVDYSIEAVVRMAGGTYYIDRYFNPNAKPRVDKPIPFAEFTAFLQQLGIAIGPPASFTPAGICDLLHKHGPIGVTLGGAIAHEIVVWGIDTDPTTNECSVVYHDPNPGVGAASMMSFTDFDAKYGSGAAATVNLFFYS